MPNDEKNKNAPSIWAWENTAHITKTTMEFGFAIAAVLIAGTAIYTAAKGVALSSALPAFLANPWVIAAIASYVAIYLVARSFSSYQQLYSMEGAKGQDGKNGENGKDADFSALLGGAVKGAKIVEKEVTENNSKVKKLCLELGNNREALLGEKNDQSLFLIFKDKDGKYQFKALGYNVENNNVIVTSVDNKEVKAYAGLKEALGVDDKVGLTAVAVSNQGFKALQDSVTPNLQDVVAKAAISKALEK